MLRQVVHRGLLAFLLAGAAWAAQAGGLLGHLPGAPTPHAVVGGGSPVYPPPGQ